MEEIWKDIKGFEGRYMVSNHGRVKSMNYNKQKGNERVLVPLIDTEGYLRVKFNYKAYKIHRLVASEFLGDATNLVVNHKDFNKQNNHVDNLEIITGFENSMHYYLDKNKKGGFSSKFIGVHYCKRNKIWGSARRINGKKYVAYFKTEQQAQEISQLNDIDYLEFKANRKLKTA
jgi:hypothetical protein